MIARTLSVLAFVLFSFVLLYGPPSAPTSPPAPQASASPLFCADPGCYLSYDQITASLQSAAAQYPSLAALSDAGLAWEGTRHLWLLRMTNLARTGPKPALFIVGGQHARDVVPPEVALRFIDYMLRNYGTDPDATWLLDNRDIRIIPLVNPDGYNQLFYNAQCTRIKNTDSASGCQDPLHLGTDINLNYPYEWGTGGVSSDPCSNSYPGFEALSEPESAHVLAAMTAASPSLVLQLAAPSSGSGRSIRYPWGWTSNPAPDVAGLDTLGWALGRLNGTPRGSVTQHNRGGATAFGGIIDDTAYGQLGVPALTMNIGDSPDVACADLDALAQAQLPALLYAAKAAGPSTSDTLGRSFGPDPQSLSASVVGSRSLQITAVMSANVGIVAGAVYRVDDPGIDGSGEAMSGAFGGGIVAVSATADLGTVPNGRHILFVQGKNEADRWGVLASTFFTVTGNPTSTPTRTPGQTASPPPSLTRTPTAPPTFTRTATPIFTPSATATPQQGCLPGLYVSYDVPRIIQAHSTVTSTLSVASGGVVADVDVRALALDGRVGDLSAELVSPHGTHIALFGNICPGSTFTQQNAFTLDDGALLAIGAVCPPDSEAAYRPAQPLAALIGEEIAGTWTLVISNPGGYTPTLNGWGLAITGGQNCQTPTQTPLSTLTAVPSNTGTATRTPALTGTPSVTRTATLTNTPSGTRTPILTSTPTLTRTSSATRTVTSTNTPSATRTQRPPSTASPLPCATYTDVHPSQYFYVSVDWLTCRGIVGGYSDGTFRPFNNATRAQLVKMVVLGEGWNIYEPSQPTFNDVQPGDWFYGVIETAYLHGIIGGYGDGTFRPFSDITRGQLSKIIVLAAGWPLLDPDAGHFSDVPKGSAFYLYVETAQAHGIISGYGDGTFRPALNATRGQLSKMLYSALTGRISP